MGCGLMTSPDLAKTAHLLVASGKGLLAMDESNPTCDKRFVAQGIAPTVENRRAYRDLIATTHGLADCISGAILYDETIRETALNGTPFVKLLTDAGIIPGIKVDLGAKQLAGHPLETVTEGLDGLGERLEEYGRMGARFAKWRAVIRIGEGLPSWGAIDANAHALARYAALCQEAGLVPIVEPEVLMDGPHDLKQCRQASDMILRTLFQQLDVQRVALAGIILKPNMILPGLACPDQGTVETVAEATLQCFLGVVPAAIGGIAFLSGGQSGELASARLNAMNVIAKQDGAKIPWSLTFSFSRAIQQPALEIWRGLAANREAAQAALLHRARCNKLALQGEYSAAMDPA